MNLSAEKSATGIQVGAGSRSTPVSVRLASVYKLFRPLVSCNNTLCMNVAWSSVNIVEHWLYSMKFCTFSTIVVSQSLSYNGQTPKCPFVIGVSNTSSSPQATSGSLLSPHVWDTPIKKD